MPGDQTRRHLLLAITIAAAALIHVSIAVSQILLGVGILLLLLFERKLPFPRIWLPLSCFFAWTVLADAVSPDFWGGRAQIRKFFVFLFIPLVYSVFSKQFHKVFYLIAAWTVTSTASGFWGLVQFVWKYQHEKSAPQGFYMAYLERRITGFESHWMTFGALQLSVFLLVLAQLFFSDRRMPRWAYMSLLVLSAAILLGWTRSIWLGMVASALYLVWFWRPKMTLAIPVLIALLFLVSPPATRERFRSFVQPRAEVDSNRHRAITFVTGLQMIKAHPWFGIGPEEIGRNFTAYVPADIPRPLPAGYYGHLHNIYVQYAAERGIPALVFLLWFIGLTVYDCFGAAIRLGRELSQQRFILHGTVAVVIAILVEGAAEYNLGDSEVLMMFVCVVALGYAALASLARDKA